MGRLSDAMLGDDLYPESPGFTDTGTSRDAAQRIKPTASASRERCFSCLAKSDGLTADEVAARLGLSILYVRPRMSELNAAGRIEKTKRRRTNTSGLSAAVYRVTGRLL